MSLSLQFKEAVKKTRPLERLRLNRIASELREEPLTHFLVSNDGSSTRWQLPHPASFSFLSPSFCSFRSLPQVAFVMKEMNLAFPGGVESHRNCWRRLKIGCSVFLLLETLLSLQLDTLQLCWDLLQQSCSMSSGAPADASSSATQRWTWPPAIRRVSPTKTGWERRAEKREHASRLCARPKTEMSDRC